MVFQSNMLFKKDFKTVFESCKCAITKNGVLVGKGYIYLMCYLNMIYLMRIPINNVSFAYALLMLLFMAC